jgi:hypothetical protein
MAGMAISFLVVSLLGKTGTILGNFLHSNSAYTGCIVIAYQIIPNLLV